MGVGKRRRLIPLSSGLVAAITGVVAFRGGPVSAIASVVSLGGDLIAPIASVVAQSGGIVAQSGGIVAQSGGIVAHPYPGRTAFVIGPDTQRLAGTHAITACRLSATPFCSRARSTRTGSRSPASQGIRAPGRVMHHKRTGACSTNSTLRACHEQLVHPDVMRSYAGVKSPSHRVDSSPAGLRVGSPVPAAS